MHTQEIVTSPRETLAPWVLRIRTVPPVESAIPLPCWRITSRSWRSRCTQHSKPKNVRTPCAPSSSNISWPTSPPAVGRPQLLGTRCARRVAHPTQSRPMTPQLVSSWCDAEAAVTCGEDRSDGGTAVTRSGALCNRPSTALVTTLGCWRHLPSSPPCIRGDARPARRAPPWTRYCHRRRQYDSLQ